MPEGTIAADELRLFIERVERLTEEKQALQHDINGVYAKAKARGYDIRTMRECVKLRALETHVRQEREALLDTYKAALGLDYSETPLGGAAVQRAAEQFRKSCEPFEKVTIQTPGNEPVTVHERAH